MLLLLFFPQYWHFPHAFLPVEDLLTIPDLPLIPHFLHQIFWRWPPSLRSLHNSQLPWHLPDALCWDYPCAHLSVSSFPTQVWWLEGKSSLFLMFVSSEVGSTRPSRQHKSVNKYWLGCFSDETNNNSQRTKSGRTEACEQTLTSAGMCCGGTRRGGQCGGCRRGGQPVPGACSEGGTGLGSGPQGHPPTCGPAVWTSHPGILRQERLRALSLQKVGSPTLGSCSGLGPSQEGCLVAQSCPTLCDAMDGSLPGSSVHGILQARILEWVAIPFPRGTPDPGMELGSPALQPDSLPTEPPGNHSRSG